MWGNSYYGYPMMEYGGYAGFGVMHVVLSIFWAVVLIAIIVTMVRWARGERSPWHHANRHSALDILKERYAKGEIDKTEFEEKKRDISA